MRRYSNALLLLFFLLAILATGATGYWIGRNHVTQVDLIWTPIPDAVTVGWSVDDDDAICVYVGGQLLKTVTVEDGTEFEKWEEVLEEGHGQRKRAAAPKTQSEGTEPMEQLPRDVILALIGATIALLRNGCYAVYTRRQRGQWIAKHCLRSLRAVQGSIKEVLKNKKGDKGFYVETKY